MIIITNLIILWYSFGACIIQAHPTRVAFCFHNRLNKDCFNLTCVTWLSTADPFLWVLGDFLTRSCDLAIRLIYPYRLVTFLSIFSTHMFLLWFNALRIYGCKSRSRHLQNLYIDCISLSYIFWWYNRVLWMNVCRDIWSHMLHVKEYNQNICICISL